MAILAVVVGVYLFSQGQLPGQQRDPQSSPSSAGTVT